MTKEELMELFSNWESEAPSFGDMPEQLEQTIGPIPEGGMSQQDILDMIIGGGGGGMGRIAEKGSNMYKQFAMQDTYNVINKILSRNTKAVKNLNAHHNIDKIMKNEDFKNFLKQNPGSKITGGPFPGIRLPDAKSVTPQLNPPSKRPENLLGAMMLMLASPLIGKNLADIGYGKLEGEPPNIGLPPKQR